jgi:hypothetical protein
MMFRSVTNTERRMQKYGVSALRLRTTLVAAPTTNNISTEPQEEGRVVALKRFCARIGKKMCLISDASQTRNHRFEISPSRSIISNQMTSQKGAVLRMAFGYAGAWFLTWTPFFVQVVSSFAAVTRSNLPPAGTVVIFVAWTTPLQGFFNFVVFMAPKVRTARMLAKRGGGRTYTSSSDNNNQNQQHLAAWCQALYMAYMDRGRHLDDRNMITNNYVERRSLWAKVTKISQTFRIIFERMNSFTVATSSRYTRSPEVAETNECVESGMGERSADASP